jgi:osmotically-inducible protein OsmY
MNKNMLAALGSAICLTLSAAPVMAQTQAATDASYQSHMDKAAADYDAGLAACARDSGDAKDICVSENKLARARSEADTVAQFRNRPQELGKARAAVANAQYELATANCAAPKMSSAKHSDCMARAKTKQIAALDDASTGAQAPDAGVNAAPSNVQKCDALEGADKAACLARGTGSKAKNVIADSVITTKIKAGLVRDPVLKATQVHVETVEGVVMLSGYVPSLDEAEKAEAMARSVKGVTQVKSELKVR